MTLSRRYILSALDTSSVEYLKFLSDIKSSQTDPSGKTLANVNQFESKVYDIYCKLLSLDCRG